ncbi:MAG: XRE family transcriptional regulator [Alphaproteobacteria bacterium]|nr:XRE family transcriptional regulator [Alphaproteobacteria bacterium]
MPENLHPGVYLRKELENRGWAQSDLTFILGCNPKGVNQIINGKQGISPAMSKALGEAFGFPADHFANLQKAYDVSQAHDPDPAVSLRAQLQSNYPIREMIKRGWLKDEEGKDLAQQLAEFFEVNNADDVPYMAHAAKKSLYEEQEIPPTQLAWLFRVRQMAKSIAVPPYSPEALRKAVIRMRDFIIEPEEARHVPRVLAESGVRFIIVEPLPLAKIDGVCFWLDENSPVIGLSARYDRIDNFWFVLRHEIEHVLRGHGKGEVPHIDELEGKNASFDSGLPEEERIANVAAADFGVPAAKMDSFMVRKDPFYYEKDVLAFAKLQRTHPGIVVGQIQHRLGRYDYLRRHQVKIRQFVLPGSIADGWKQTAAA